MAEPDQNVAEPDQITVEPNQSMAEPDQTTVKPNEGTAEQEIVGQPEYILPEEEEEQRNDSVAGSGERWPGWPGESVFRLLVPLEKVGRIIGRKGEVIKKMCEEAKAHIKILDVPLGVRERAVMVFAKEEPDSSLPPAIDGLLRVHKRVVDGLDGDSSQEPPSGVKVTTRLLVPDYQAGSLIGKQGARIKSIKEESNCIVHVLPTGVCPIFAIKDDRVVEVVGEPLAVHKALELIASHLRKFLVDHSVIPVFEMQMQMANAQEHLPPPQSWGLPPQGFPPNVSGVPECVVGSYFSHPWRLENYYTPAYMPPLNKQPHQRVSVYGRETPMALHPSNNQPAPSVVTEKTQMMQIPSSYSEAVTGADGSSIGYIRQTSGAIVTIQETRGVPEEMTVKITGTSSQIHTAQQLILILLVLLITAGAVMPIKKMRQLFQQRTPKIGISSLCSCGCNF